MGIPYMIHILTSFLILPMLACLYEVRATNSLTTLNLFVMIGNEIRPPILNTNNAVQDAQRNFQLRSELTSLRWQLRSQPTNQEIINRIAAIEQELQIIVPGNPQGER